MVKDPLRLMVAIRYSLPYFHVCPRRLDAMTKNPSHYVKNDLRQNIISQCHVEGLGESAWERAQARVLNSLDTYDPESFK